VLASGNVGCPATGDSEEWVAVSASGVIPESQVPPQLELNPAAKRGASITYGPLGDSPFDRLRTGRGAAPGLVDFTDQEADFCGACLQAGEPIGGVELDT
jgi:hypothetical protein